jgi:hypothetical protein
MTTMIGYPVERPNLTLKRNATGAPTIETHRNIIAAGTEFIQVRTDAMVGGVERCRAKIESLDVSRFPTVVQ